MSFSLILSWATVLYICQKAVVLILWKGLKLLANKLKWANCSLAKKLKPNTCVHWHLNVNHWRQSTETLYLKMHCYQLISWLIQCWCILFIYSGLFIDLSRSHSLRTTLHKVGRTLHTSPWSFTSQCFIWAEESVMLKRTTVHLEVPPENRVDCVWCVCLILHSNTYCNLFITTVNDAHSSVLNSQCCHYHL